ncbi:MAG: spondin domain-containing protein [Halolamina sp.]|uniref:spondin domain-containing protein n=1 Tax=Halolamina sp. TaxID=1940283 RepID=UPI002FC27BBB
MSDDSSRRRFLQLTSSAALVGLAGCSGASGEDDSMEDDSMVTDTMTEEDMDDESMENESMDDESTDEEMMDASPTTFTVRIANVAPTDFYASDGSTGGQIWITAGAYAVHSETNPVFTAEESASLGLEALAEAGPPTGFEMEDGLVTELQNTDSVAHAGAYTPEDTVEDPNDPTGEVPGAPPIAPDGAFEFEIEAEPGQRLALASMFVPSNDVFFAPGESSIPLFDMDDAPVEGDVTESIALWDAGTELNQQPGLGPDQAPAQDSPDQGADEDGVVRRLADVDDGYDYPDASDALELTLTPQ